MQDIGYVVTITIGRCLGAVTSGGPLRIFQCDQSEGNESSGEDFYSSEGIFGSGRRWNGLCNRNNNSAVYHKVYDCHQPTSDTQHSQHAKPFSMFHRHSKFIIIDESHVTVVVEAQSGDSAPTES